MLKSQATIIQTNAGSGALSPTRVLAARSSSRTVPTAEALKDPATLVRYLTSLHRELDALSSALSTPILGSVLVQGLPFTGGASKYVAHSLGRAPIGWIVTRAQTAAWAGYEQTLETGHDATKEIRLVTTTTGTFDILFF